MIEFRKLHGAGNDFIVIDNRTAQLPAEAPQTYAQWCNRHTGIGADGLILLEEDPVSDFRMRYYNADGHPGSLCGNGARCAVWQAVQWGFAPQPELTFHAGSLQLKGAVLDPGSPGAARIQMPRWTTIAIESAPDADAYLNTGSPHVILVLPPEQSLDTVDLPTLARPIRHNPIRPGGTNVNLIQVQTDGRLRIRTFERGVEAETLACGTGITAAALVWAQRQQLELPWQVSVQAQGGDLTVTAHPDGLLELEGPVQAVFDGQIAAPAQWR